ncbi:MBL fold metallo-hydrolase [Gracilibacillus massiliensis]|uniref:MBL fold metallo-hydrolase n=1 Tax=Gracilibacillus massiliensis TaxID=1564956 RepID=UPI00071E0045|nr:MBL fold metallo-hydrolase [Gracilibacillus massiliensis]
MKVEKITLGSLSTNCYIVIDQKEAIIIDPASDSESIKNKVTELGVVPKVVLLTHAHFDHIGALEDIREHFKIPTYLHEMEHDWLRDSKLNGSSLFGLGEVTAKPAEYHFDKSQYRFGSIELEVRHTPGHSPGGVAFVFREDRFVVGGDSLFAGGIGRTDLPGGEYQQLEKSIQDQFYTLPNDFVVYPGHGPNTTIKAEKLNNPFVQG